MFAVFDYCKQEDQSALMSNHRQEMTWTGLFCLLRPVGKYFSIQNQSMNGHIVFMDGNLEISQFSTSCKPLFRWIIFYHFVCRLVASDPFLFFRDWTPVHVRRVSIHILKETAIHNKFRFCCLSAHVNIFVWNMRNKVLNYYILLKKLLLCRSMKLWNVVHIMRSIGRIA